MSKKYSIGFFIGILVLAILFMWFYKISYNKAIERNENIDFEMISDSNFVLKEKEGYITVYNKNGQVYEYTTISSSDLPISMQEELKHGIAIDNISEVYGFLENYSS